MAGKLKRRGSGRSEKEDLNGLNAGIGGAVRGLRRAVGEVHPLASSPRPSPPEEEREKSRGGRRRFRQVLIDCKSAPRASGVGCNELFTPCTGAVSLLEAEADAAKDAASGDVVLLIPACSSLGEFRNYQHRCEGFCRAAKSIGGGA